MLLREPPRESRSLLTKNLQTDLVIIGGGCAGVCAAITAARAGTKVVLIQDRPLLGGNGSSEVRLWVLGATAHMGCNNRWAREGGVIDELLTENMWRNKEGNTLIFDTILLEKVIEEKNITLLLNSAVYELAKSDPDTIKSVRAFCSQNSTVYEVGAPLFCDASGDGIAGFLAGAAFRIGSESREEFGEKFAPLKASSELLGHTIYFYSEDTGRPVKFVRAYVDDIRSTNVRHASKVTVKFGVPEFVLLKAIRSGEPIATSAGGATTVRPLADATAIYTGPSAVLLPAASMTVAVSAGEVPA